MIRGGIKVKRSRCSCGKVKSKDSRTCMTCHNNRMTECKTKAIAHVTRGTCPECGTNLVRNSAMAGWWQCGAYACEAMRLPEHKGKPDCSFQCFTA